jgi:hypothetical protein
VVLPFRGIFCAIILLWAFLKGAFHCAGCVVSHTGYHVGVGVEGYGYGGAPQKLLDVLVFSYLSVIS